MPLCGARIIVRMIRLETRVWHRFVKHACQLAHGIGTSFGANFRIVKILRDEFPLDSYNPATQGLRNMEPARRLTKKYRETAGKPMSCSDGHHVHPPARGGAPARFSACDAALYANDCTVRQRTTKRGRATTLPETSWITRWLRRRSADGTSSAQRSPVWPARAGRRRTV